MATKAPKVVQVPDDEYEAIKQAIIDRAQSFEVIGSTGIRDCVSREIIQPGGVVRLDPEVPGNVLLVKARAVRPADDKAETPPPGA